MQLEPRVRWVLLAILTFTIFNLFGCSQSPDTKERGFLEKGRKEFKRKNFTGAVLYFKNAVAAKPWDAEPHYQMGLSYLAGNDFKSAIAEFRKTTELNPKYTSAQLKLAELMSTSRDKNAIAESQKRAQATLASIPDDPDALDVLAVTDMRLRNPESAQSHLEQALRKSPGHLKSLVLLAQVKQARNDVAGAEKALLQASAQQPKTADLKTYLGEFYLAHGRAAEAEQEFHQALAIDPKQSTALMDLGAMEVKAGRPDQAEQIYRQVAAIPGTKFKPVHAQFLLQSGRKEEAVAELEKLSAADPGDPNIRKNLVEIYLLLNRPGDAEKILTAAIKKNGPDVETLMQRGSIYVDSGKYSEAEADMKQVLHSRKESADAHYLLAKASRGLGNTTRQKQELEEVLHINPAFLAARIDLAVALLADKKPQAALTLIEEAPEGQMNSAPLILERNWALLALGRKEEARKGIDRVLATGRVPEALLQDAAMKLDRQDYIGARKSIEETLGRTPEDARALFVLVQSYVAQKQTAAAVQVMREYALKQPTSARIQEYMGRVLAASGDRVGARRAFEAARVARPGFVDADFALAELDTLEGKLDDGRKRLAEVVSSHPDNKIARQLLAQSEMAAGKIPEAIEQFRKVVALDDKDAMALNALAWLLGESKQPDEALKYVERAAALTPGNPAVEDTMGWIYFEQGLYPLAVVHLEAAAAGESTAVRKYHLAMAYLKAGKAERGRQTLEAAIKMDPRLPEAQIARRAFGIVPN